MKKIYYRDDENIHDIVLYENRTDSKYLVESTFCDIVSSLLSRSNKYPRSILNKRIDHICKKYDYDSSNLPMRDLIMLCDDEGRNIDLNTISMEDVINKKTINSM